MRNGCILLLFFTITVFCAGCGSELLDEKPTERGTSTSTEVSTVVHERDLESQPQEKLPPTREKRYDTVENSKETSSHQESVRNDEVASEREGNRDPSTDSFDAGMEIWRERDLESFERKEEASFPDRTTTREKTPVRESPSWLQKSSSSLEGNIHVHTVIASAQGSHYIAGRFSGSLVYQTRQGKKRLQDKGYSLAAFVAKLNSSKQVEWLKVIGRSYQIQRQIAVDRSGNVFCVSSFRASITVGRRAYSSKGNDDILVTKLDKFGKIVWTKHIGSRSYDIAKAIQVDGRGDVYIAGSFHDALTIAGVSATKNQSGGFVAKLNTNGVFQWFRPMGYGTSGQDLVVDKLGQVTLMGLFLGKLPVGSETLQSVGSRDVFVTKLDITGEPIWARSVGGSYEDIGISLGVDGKGNSYIFGTSSNTLFHKKKLVQPKKGSHFLLKFSSQGKFLWATSFLWTSTSFSHRSLVVDIDGHAYIADSFVGIGTLGYQVHKAYESDILVAKLSPQGTMVWATTLGGTGSQNGAAIVLNQKQELVVACNTTKRPSSGTPVDKKDLSLLLFSLEANGLEGRIMQCQSDLDCPLSSHCQGGLCSQNKSNQCVQEQFSACLSSREKSDVCLMVNGSLHHQAKKSCPASQTCSWQKCRKNCRSRFDCKVGESCVQGLCWKEKGESYQLEKFAIGHVEHIFHTKHKGNSYILGSYSGTTKVGTTDLTIRTKYKVQYLFVTKLDKEGLEEWTVPIKGKVLEGYKIEVDMNGNSYVVGSFSQELQVGKKTLSARKTRGFVIKVDKNGRLLWVHALPEREESRCRDVKMDQKGNLFLMGTFRRNITLGSNSLIAKSVYGDIFLAKMTSQGKILWGTRVGGKEWQSLRGSVLDGQGNIYLTGSFSNEFEAGNRKLSTKATTSTFLLKANSQGRTLWAKSFEDIYPSSLAIGTKGNLYMTGSSVKSQWKMGSLFLRANYQDSRFFAKLTKDGRVLWVKVFDGGYIPAIATLITTDESGFVWVSGAFSGKTTLNGKQYTTKGSDNMFVLRADSSGKVLSIIQRGNTDWGRIQSIVAEKKGISVLRKKQGLDFFFVP